MSKLVTAVNFRKATISPETKIINSVELKEEAIINVTSKEINNNLPNFELECDTDNEIPDTIQITYKNYINILLIHEAIRRKFSCEKGMLETYEKRLENINNLIKITTCINKMRRFEKEKNELMNKIEDIKGSINWKQYIEKSKKYLLAYSEIDTEKHKSVVVIGKKTKSEQDKKDIDIKLNIIDCYIPIASEYININISRIEKLQAECPSCGNSLKNFKHDEEDSICECPKCGWFRENLAKSSFNRESGKTSTSNKNDYNDRDNFYKAAIHFACNQTKNFNENLFNDLDDYFSNNNYPIGEQVKKLSLSKAKSKGINFQLMIKALSYLSKNINKLYSEYYEDAWLIMHNYWGFPANNIEHLLPRMMQIYDVTQEIYNEMTIEERNGRNAALNTQFRLLVTLLACDYQCEKADFKIPTSDQSLQTHIKCWKLMCQRSGTKYVPF